MDKARIDIENAQAFLERHKLAFDAQKLEGTKRAPQTEQNLLIVVLSIFAGLMTTIFFTGFIALFIATTFGLSEGNMIVIGLLIIGLAVYANRAFKGNSAFLRTLYLGVLFSGKGFLALGIVDALSTSLYYINNGLIVTLSFAFITLLSYYPFKSRADQFFPVFLTAISYFVLNAIGETNGWVGVAFFALITFAILGLYQWKSLPPSLYPARLALVGALGFNAFAISEKFSSALIVNVIANSGPLSFLNLIVAPLLIWLVFTVMKSLGKLGGAPFWAAIALASVFILISSPLVLIAICFLILGYHFHERIVLVYGGILLGVGLWLYYYNLEISLLYKSYLLLTSGAVLIMARFVTKLLGWDRGEKP